MDSIASKTVFIPLLLLLPLCKSFVVRLENSVNVDDITWHDPNDINQFFANGDLDFTFTPPEKSSGSETQESSNEENLNEYIINPQVIHVGESNDNSEGEQDEEVHPGEEGCGEGTLCKEERDESMFQREESIKTHILNSLRMTAPPNISEEDKLSIDSPAIRKMLRLRDLDEDYLIPDVNIETTSRNLISAAKRRKYKQLFFQIYHCAIYATTLMLRHKIESYAYTAKTYSNFRPFQSICMNHSCSKNNRCRNDVLLNLTGPIPTASEI